MTSQKLFSGRSSGKFSSHRTAGKQKSGKGRRVLAGVLIALALLESLYCLLIFSNIPAIVNLRNDYIVTAMSTMSHTWLATYFIPKDIIEDVMQGIADAQIRQDGIQSTWTRPTEPATPESMPTQETTTTPPVQTETEPVTAQDQQDFFTLFHELDKQSMLDYVKENPQVTAEGWDHIRVDEAGLQEDGLPVYTTAGDQVLAIDAENQILILRVSGSGYRGVLSIAKDPARLRLGISEHLGGMGEHAGDIAQRYGGVLAMTGSGFLDEGGGGNGGELAGACMSDGKSYGEHYGWGYKRLELREDNRMYIMDSYQYFSDDCTDAVEFRPAMIVDGEDIYDNLYTGTQPRACLGQNYQGEILMLVIEGRLASSAGTNVAECTEILLRYDCAQAMNLDGGTSAIMWYNGRYITRCSNTVLDEGRYLPNAWVYGAAAEE